MTTSKQSSPFVVLSWNVLHMVHEINYSFDASPVIDKYSIRTNWTNEKFPAVAEFLTSRIQDSVYLCDF